MPRRKPPTVTVTNPRASRLPSQLGTFADSPATPEPIRPKTTPKHRQITSGPRVQITGPKGTPRA